MSVKLVITIPGIVSVDERNIKIDTLPKYLKDQEIECAIHRQENDALWSGLRLMADYLRCEPKLSSIVEAVKKKCL